MRWFVAAAMTGVVNILMAFVIIQWKGTLFHLTVQMTGMLTSPMAGLFVVGMLFPFCNTKVCEQVVLMYKCSRRHKMYIYGTNTIEKLHMLMCIRI